MLGELRGVEHDDVKIGMPVQATFIDFPDSEVSPAWTLYAWEAAK
ncbi:nucleic acid-binding protein [Mycolicibacterium fortuitum]|nr:nucleic acid-binding protein [Mycolicibacterium fortuitum]